MSNFSMRYFKSWLSAGSKSSSYSVSFPLGACDCDLQRRVSEALRSAFAVQFFEVIAGEGCVAVKGRFENILELLGIKRHAACGIGIEIGFQILPGPRDKVVVEFGGEQGFQLLRSKRRNLREWRFGGPRNFSTTSWRVAALLLFIEGNLLIGPKTDSDETVRLCSDTYSIHIAPLGRQVSISYFNPLARN